VNIMLSLLQDFMALLAYKEPEESPMFHLLSLEYRQQLADSLNRTILGWLTLLFYYKFQYFILPLLNIMRSCPFFLRWCWWLAAYFNLPNYTAMEKLIQQATVVRQCLNEEAGKVIGILIMFLFQLHILMGAYFMPHPIIQFKPTQISVLTD